MKSKSVMPMKSPTKMLETMTIVVSLTVSDFEGQMTFLSSSLTSVKNLMLTFGCFIKNRTLGKGTYAIVSYLGIFVKYAIFILYIIYMPMPDFQHRRHVDSFSSAFRGLIFALKTQPNFKIMFAFAFLSVFVGFFLKITRLEFLIIILTIMVVFLCEMINTSIESVVDLVTEEWRENAKIAKDVSGGMVLLSVVFSFVIGLVIFLPKL